MRLDLAAAGTVICGQHSGRARTNTITKAKMDISLHSRPDRQNATADSRQTICNSRQMTAAIFGPLLNVNHHGKGYPSQQFGGWSVERKREREREGSRRKKGREGVTEEESNLNGRDVPSWSKESGERISRSGRAARKPGKTMVHNLGACRVAAWAPRA
jgi:hypothetical protein